MRQLIYRDRLDKCYTGRYLGLCRQFHETYPQIQKSLISESGTAGIWKSLISKLPANDVDKIPESASLALLEIPVKRLLERLSFRCSCQARMR